MLHEPKGHAPMVWQAYRIYLGDDDKASRYIDVRYFIPDANSLHIIITRRSSAGGDMTQLKGVWVGEMKVVLYFTYSKC